MNNYIDESEYAFVEKEGEAFYGVKFKDNSPYAGVVVVYGTVSIKEDKELDLATLSFTFNIQDAGGRIDKIYYCPHLESEDCKCRKPKAGMLEEAFCDFPSIDVSNSYMVGDSDSDIQAGIRKNLNTIKVDSQYTLSSWAREMLKK